MAEKNLNVRIVNKNGSLTDWNSSDLVLKTGEIALAYVEVATKDAKGNIINVPRYLMKVGHDNKTFAELDWLVAPASDVYAWAKLENPTIDQLPANLKTAIKNLQSAVGSSGSVAESIQTAIEALDVAESKDTDAANGGVVISAISETDGKISVTRRALDASDIPTLAITQIDGLQAALDAKGAKSAVEKNAEDIAAEITAREATDEKVTKLETAVGSATTGLVKDVADLKTTVGGADSGLVKGLADLTATVSTNKTNIEKAVSSETDARTAADTALGERIDGVSGRVDTLEGTITGLTGAMHFKGVVDKLPAVTDYVAGDVVIVGQKEYVLAGEGDSKAWYELGDEGSHLTKTEAADTYATKSTVTALDTRVQTIEGTGEGSVKKALSDAKAYADEKKSEAISTVKGTTSDTSTAETVAGAKKYADEKVKALADGQVATNEADIAALTVEVGKKALATDLDAAKTRITNLETSVGTDDTKGLRLKVKTLETTVGSSTAGLVKDVADLKTSKANTSDVTALTNRVKAIEDDYLKEADTFILDCGGPTA